tara:strand:- start:479 stop:640 length:162 start_codon:yes stop_codon:yes gene_type:complete
MNNEKRKTEDPSRNSENYKINDENIDKPITRKDKFKFLNEVFESEDETDVYLG